MDDTTRETPILILTGLSGSGKSTALRVFEDLGFFCVDGLPVSLAPKLLDLFGEKGEQHYKGLALGMDARQADWKPDGPRPWNASDPGKRRPRSSSSRPTPRRSSGAMPPPGAPIPWNASAWVWNRPWTRNANA